MDEEREKNDFILNDIKEFGEEQVEIALDDMRDYFAAKRSIDDKATVNEEWWRLRHWNVLNERNEGKKAGVEVGSAWLFNSLANKHADIMDSFPAPNVLPREADDEVEAKILSSILPVIMEQNDYQQVYRDMGWSFCKDGAAITSVLWDQSKHDGLGDVSIKNVDVHNLAWKPGIQDIQESDKVYYTYLENVDVAKAAWPKIADKIGPQDTGIVTQYIHDDNVDTSNMVEVVNMYYKRTVSVPAVSNVITETGQVMQMSVNATKTILHLAIIVGNQLAFCSENEEGYENGFYEHGQFPFVIRRLFPVKDTPWGFGYLDVMKNPQRDIDKLDQAVIRNAMMKARPRYWARKNANIDMDQFANWDNELVEVATGDLGEAVSLMNVPDVPGGAITHLSNKIEELKETSGNRDFSQGASSGGVTAASAIAALQEAGSKLSRDVNKELYRGCREEYYLVIELIRQFYSEPRSFRVDASTANGIPQPKQNSGYEVIGKTGGDYRFILYSNAGIVDRDTVLPNGITRHVRPVFDIMVSAEKQSPFSRAAQNEIAKELYGMGMFAPENEIPAKTCLDMMDFDGKDKVVQNIEQNGLIMRQFQAAMQLIQNQAMVDPAFGQIAMQEGLIDPQQMAEQQQAMAQQGQPREGTPEERVSATGNSYADRIRKRSAEAAAPM